MMKKWSLCMCMVFSLVAGCIFVPDRMNAEIIIYPTEASGGAVQETDTCVLDYSNVSDGYVMVRYKENTSKTVMVVIEGPAGESYKYAIRKNKYEVLPLTEGNGTYKVSVYLNVSGNSYAIIMSQTIEDVKLENEFAPYMRPNQYVNYNKSTKVVKKAQTLTKSCGTELAKVKKIYKYVLKNYKYDYNKAKTVQAWYLPDLNKIYKKKKGICFDYAAVMTAMLRSQGVPTKLVIGYQANRYHAWVNVYSQKEGWITGAIYFNGNKWKLMDPTYASTSKSSAKIMKSIESGRSYKAKYSY